MNDTSNSRTSFAWLNITQFLGALNDNIFKLFIIFYFIALSGTENTANITAKAGLFFVIPFILFAATAGAFADRFSKRNIIVITKLAEVLLMALGVLCLYFGIHIIIYGVLFLMALQSTFFGPSKYGIIPELVPTEKLSKANSYIQAFTY